MQNVKKSSVSAEKLLAPLLSIMQKSKFAHEKQDQRNQTHNKPSPNLEFPQIGAEKHGIAAKPQFTKRGALWQATPCRL
jgi:hypothetical protein